MTPDFATRPEHASSLWRSSARELAEMRVRGEREC